MLHKLFYIVTGATGGIGRCIAIEIARLGSDRHITLVARNKEKLKSIQQEIIDMTGNPNIDYDVVDLGNKQSILSFAQRYQESQKPLNVLVNNAAVAVTSRQETDQGIELQWAVNVLGYYWMSLAMKDLLVQTSINSEVNSRIVNVASRYAGKFDLNDVEWKTRRYDNDGAYQQSKQCNRMMTLALKEEWQNDPIVLTVCHPGTALTTLSQDLGFEFDTNAFPAAQTPFWLSVSEEGGLKSNSGKFYIDKRETSCSFQQDKSMCMRLLDLIKEY